MLPRIPFLLLHFPALFAALILVAALLVIAVASGPLFLSSAGDRAATLELEALQGRPVLTVSTYGPLDRGFQQSATGALTRATAGLPDLAPLDVSIVGVPAGVVVDGVVRPVAVVARAGVADHVTTIRSYGDAGLWIPESLARDAGVRLGGRVTVEAGGRTRAVDVAGVYRDLDAGNLDAYWRTTAVTEALAASRPLVLGTPDAVIGAFGAMVSTARFQWDMPVARSEISLRDAIRLAGGIERVRSALAVGDVPPGSVLAGAGGVEPFSESPLPPAVQAGMDAKDELRASTEAVSIAAVVVALAAMAAAGTLAARRRRVQGELLAARGLGPVGQGALASAEAVIPAVVGAVLGWLVVVALVRAFGPSSAGLDPLARAEAFRRSVQAIGLGVLLYGLAAGFASRSGLEPRTTRAGRIAAAAPWEPVVLIVAAAALYEILSRPAPDSSAPDLLILAFPVLFVAGVAGLAARLLPRIAAALRGRVPPSRVASFLAVRRVAAAPRVAVLTVTGLAVAVGVLVEAGTLGGVVDRTAHAKAVAAAGADLTLPLPRAASGPVDLRRPPGSDGAATVVVRLGGARLSPGGQVDVLAVDPSSFARAAAWDPSFSPTPLDRLLADLDERSGQRVPAIVAGATGGGPPTAGLVVQGRPVAVRIVDRVRAWPGMGSSGHSVVVVARRRMFEADPGSVTSRSTGAELWEHGDADALRERLERAGTATDGAVTLGDVARRPDLLALRWAIELLLALGITAAVVALAAMVLDQQARQRSRNVAFALARRMGLSERAHRRALSLELGSMLGSAAILGAGLAVVAATLVRSKLQVAPGLPGPTVGGTPWALLAGIGIGVLIAAIVGGWLAQRWARRTKVAEVLRGGR